MSDKIKKIIEESNPVKGWKVFKSDLTCRQFPFAVGGSYFQDGEIELCSNGFHFHENIKDLWNYYTFDPDNIVCEIEAFGEVITSDDKSVCSNIKLIKQLEWNELLKIGNNGKVNTGWSNSGDSNSGNYNSGNLNSGDRNSCHHNSGGLNSGNFNSGYKNSGHHNSGNRNSGYHNSGNFNSGNFNSGDFNSGNFNSGDFNVGLFNEKQAKVQIFDKDTSLGFEDERVQKVLNLPYSSITQWIRFSGMTDEEKASHPKAETCGGYLKTLTYHEMWKKSWDSWSEEQRHYILDLPNFDAAMFERITGIKV